MQLRPYQTEAVGNICDKLNTSRSTLAVLATGLGKTVIAAYVAKAMMSAGRIMFLAHRDILLSQARDTMHEVTGIMPDVERGEEWASEYGMFQSQIVVSSIQTQVSGRHHPRMERFNPDDFALVIVDEAHRIVSRSYRRAIEYYQKNDRLKLLCITATPDRLDEAALGQVVDTVAYEYGVLDAINDGWLVNIEQGFATISGLDISHCKTTAGDLNAGELAKAMEYEEPLQEVAIAILKYSGDKKTLVFCASVAHADRLTEILNRPDNKPGAAEFVTGKTNKQDRQRIIGGFRDGNYQYLCNVGVCTEGFDVPDIGCVIQARPTKSRALYAQCLGRGTRPLAGIVDGLPDAEARKAAILASDKPKLVVIDCVGNAGRHKLISAMDILGGKWDDAIVERATRKAKEDGKPVDVFGELAKAEVETRKQAKRAEAARRNGITAKATVTLLQISPFDKDQIMASREPGWHKGRLPTEKMIAALEKKGVPNTDKMTFHQASMMLNKLSGLCSGKQAKVLARAGYNPEGMKFERASELIGQLAANGWKRPTKPIEQSVTV